MGKTNIEWTDETWNPTRGCSRVSPGCGGPHNEGGCYAERQAIRQAGPGGAYEGLVKSTPNGPRWTGEIRLAEDALQAPLHWKKPRRVFVNSMSDLFHERLTFHDILRVFDVMLDPRCEKHTFQILTKRPERAEAWFKTVAYKFRLPRNVWIGVSVEDQKRADERIPILCRLPAEVRFLSCEPLLGPVDIEKWLTMNDPYDDGAQTCANRLHWIIVGGESGPRSRPMQLDWARRIVEHCEKWFVPCFVKQLGAVPLLAFYSAEGPDHAWHERHGKDGQVLVDGSEWDPSTDGQPPPRALLRMELRHSKGGDPTEWPEDLQVREWPEVRT